MVGYERVVDTGAIRDVTSGSAFEAIFGKCLDSGAEQFLLRHNAALLLLPLCLWLVFRLCRFHVPSPELPSLQA